MSALFTKAAKVKTTTKLWVIGIALLIMVNVPFTDNHSQSAPVPASQPHPTSTSPPIAPPTEAPKPRSLKTTENPQHHTIESSSSSSVAGYYTGTVHNQTAGLSADFTIQLQDAGGTLSGVMTVKPPLYGSGALKGKRDGQNLSFAVRSDIGTISFTGVDKGEQIAGTYTVQHPSGGLEVGSFKLAKGSATNRPGQAETAAGADTPVQPSNVIPPERVPVPAESPATITQPVPHSDSKNYASCMGGISYSCNKALLTVDEAANVHASDLRRNYASCMNGLSYSCNKGLLTPDETAKVNASDLRRNYASCMNGLSYACNKGLLTPEERTSVEASDLRRNYASCLNGLSYACNKNLLTPDELSKVQANDLRRNYSACMNNLSYACNRSLLTSDQLLEVQARDRSRQK